MNTTQTDLLESLKFTPRFVCLQIDDNGWKNYLWNIEIDVKAGSKDFKKHGYTRKPLYVDFRSGTGHAKNGVPTLPKLNDVIFSLLMDWRGGCGTFEDFCFLFGYNQDSRRAFGIWEACKKSGEKLQKLFSADEIAELEEAFQDY